jgi:hypothetical protein
MIEDGEYIVWFQTPRGNGTGRIELSGGRVSGGDSFITYEGVFTVGSDGRSFDAVIHTHRHTDGPETLFGIDEVVIRLTGTFRGAAGIGRGTVDHIPGATLGVTLIPSQDAPTPPQLDLSKIDYRPDRLPSLTQKR